MLFYTKKINVLGTLPSWERVPSAARAGEGEVPRFKVTKEQRGRARELRRSLTDAERKLWQLLRSRQLSHLKFRRQVPLGPWIADFVDYEHKIIVEADGGQHADSEHDKGRDADLAARGFRVIRFWNNDILSNTNGVLERILEAIETSPSPGPSLRSGPPSPTRGVG
jgi:very-short-patch-repair endonuclease